jgi:hypothetical protein
LLIYTTSDKETFVNTQSVEQFSEIIPTEFSINAEAGALRSNLSKEMGYNLAVMRDIIDEKTTSQAVDRSRIAAEHMYSNYRFKERQTLP